MYMKFKARKILLFLLLCITMFSGNLLNVSAEQEEWRVGMEAGYAPFNWTQQTDRNGAVPIDGSSDFAGGYDVEIAKIIADKLGKKLVIVKTEWDGLAPALTSGKIDAIIAGMSPTAERKETIDFTDIYYKSNLVILVKKGSIYENAESIEDFADAKITAQLNTFHYSVIDQIEGVNKQGAMDNFPAMRVALESGIIDGYVTERPEGVTAEEVNPNFAMVEFTEETGFKTNPEDTEIAIGIRKGEPLKAEINSIINSTFQEGDFDVIMDKAIENQPSSDSDGIWIVKIIKENWQMFLRGAGVTLYISLIGTIIGLFIGLGIGIIRTVPMPEIKWKKYVNKLLNLIFSVYIEVFRGTPMIVQAMVIYYGSAIAFGWDLNRIAAAILIVSVNTGAYMSEIVRGGIFSIDKGQFEAAQAIGMKHFQIMRHIVIPQVIRNILPATGNEFVINIKDTSVLNVIAVSELYFQAKTVSGINFRFFDTFFVACVLYFVMTFTVTRILRYAEKKMDGPESYIMSGNQNQVERPEDMAKEGR
jgi:amine acid ABC transporter, permease protein, 3-TM region, His/Glu/Gln/Arg/opine family